MYQLFTRAQLRGHDHFEFAPGCKPPFWGADSLYVSDEDMHWLQVYLQKACPGLNLFGPNLLHEKDWDSVLRAFSLAGTQEEDWAQKRAFLQEMDKFMRGALRTNCTVTLYGV